MRPDTRRRALDAAHHGLLWLTTPYSHDHPDRTRWGMTHQVLADTTSATVIEQGSADPTGRRPKGSYADPTGTAALAGTTTAHHQQTERRILAAHERTIAELARWIRGTLAGEPALGPDALHAAVADVAWSLHHHAPILADLHPDNSLIADLDDAIATLDTETRVTIGRTRRILERAVQEKPAIRQPRLGDCRAHQAAGQHVPATNGGLCAECAEFRRLHRCPPTPEIIRAWDYGRRRLTTTMIEHARTRHRQKSRKR